MSKRITILGSTGSIGTQALEVAKLRGFRVLALAAHSNIRLLEEQIRVFKPSLAAVADEKAAAALKIAVADTPVKVLAGLPGVCACAATACDTVLNGMVGMAGLEPTLAAIAAGNEVALANKETLVAAGELVTREAARQKVRILPVDSEHSAIFQALQGCPDPRAVKRLILTASGGPFFGKTRAQLEKVTLEQALKHPNWSMGAKITVDSATMMNKGLELIEAVWLFGLPERDIEVLVHRQSIVHSLVEYIDGSVIAQLGVPDMRVPIQYALTYPERFESGVQSLRLEDWKTLTFENMDDEAFPAVRLCRDAVARGGLYPPALNAANEAANRLFREGHIPFSAISARVEKAMETAKPKQDYTLEDVLETAASAARAAENPL